MTAPTFATRGLRIACATIGLASNNPSLLEQEAYFDPDLQEANPRIWSLLSSLHRVDDVPYGPDLDGYLTIVDRKKDMIKTSGFQVWPREIEEVLATHPAIREVSVAGMPDPVKEKADASKPAGIKKNKKVSPKSLAVFTRQFSVMIDAGLPLVQCLEILGTQEEDKNFGAVILETRAEVEGGASLADAMKKNPNITKNARVTTPLPTLKRRSRNSVIGSIGCSVRSSHRTNAANAPAASARASITRPIEGRITC